MFSCSFPVLPARRQLAYLSCESRTSPAFALVLVFISVSPSPLLACSRAAGSRTSLDIRFGFHSFAPFLSELDSIFRSPTVSVSPFGRSPLGSTDHTDQDGDDASFQIRFGFHFLAP